MASIKVVIRKNKKNKAGEVPIAIRVTENRKSTFVFLGHRINSKDWDEKKSVVKKSHPNSTRLNNLLTKKIADVQEYLISIESKGNILNIDEVKSIVSNKPNLKNGLKAVAEQFLKEKEDLEKYSQVGPDRAKIDKFIDFVNGDILLEKIDLRLLEKFKVFLKTKYKNSDRSVFNHMVMIRTLFNRAIKYGLVDAQYYPFGPNGYSLKRPQAEKIGLEAEEIKLFEGYKCKKGTTVYHAKNIFLTSFYLAGARVSDVLCLRWDEIKGDRIYYTMRKNSKVGTIKVSDKLKLILNDYKKKRKKGDVFVFPDVNTADLEDKKDVHRKIGTATKKYNKWLQKIADELGIDKKLSFHIARHSFGNISGDRIPIQMLQKLYRHSDIQTTINYQNSFINKDTDEALDKVLDL